MARSPIGKKFIPGDPNAQEQRSKPRAGAGQRFKQQIAYGSRGFQAQQLRGVCQQAGVVIVPSGAWVSQSGCQAALPGLWLSNANRNDKTGRRNAGARELVRNRFPLPLWAMVAELKARGFHYATEQHVQQWLVWRGRGLRRG